MLMACKAAILSLSASVNTWVVHQQPGGVDFLKRRCKETKLGIGVNVSNVRTSRQRLNTTTCINGFIQRPLTRPETLVEYETLVESVNLLENRSTESSQENQAQQNEDSFGVDSNDQVGGRHLFNPFRRGKVLSRSIKCLVSETAVGARWSDPTYAYPSLVRGRTAGAANLVDDVANTWQSLGTEESTVDGSELHTSGLRRDGLRKRLDAEGAANLFDGSADTRQSLGTEEPMADGFELHTSGLGRDGLRKRLGAEKAGLRKRLDAEEAEKKILSNGGLRGATGGGRHNERVVGEDLDVEAPEEPLRRGSNSPSMKAPAGERELYSFSGNSSSSDKPMDLLEMADGLLEGLRTAPSTSRLKTATHEASTRQVNQIGGLPSQAWGLDHSSRAEEGSSNPPSTSYGSSEVRSDSVSSKTRPATDFGPWASREKPRSGLQGGVNWTRSAKGQESAEETRGYWGKPSGEENMQLGADSFLGRRQPQTLIPGRSKDVWRRREPYSGEPGENDQGGVGIKSLSSSAGSEVGTKTGSEAKSGLESTSRLEAKSGLGSNTWSGSMAGSDTGLRTGLDTGFGEQRRVSVLDDELGLFVERLSKVGLGAAVSGNRNIAHEVAENGAGTASAELEVAGKEVLPEIAEVELEVAENGALPEIAWGELEAAENEVPAGGELEVGENEPLPANAPFELDMAESEAFRETAGGELEAAENEGTAGGELGVGESGPLPASAFYDENFLERFRYTRPPPNPNLPLFMDIRNHWTAPEDPMPPPYYPKNCKHEKSGPLPGYPHGRVPRPKPPGPLLHGKRPDFWVVNPNNNRLVVPRAIRAAPGGKLPGVVKLLEGWTGLGCMTREKALGGPLTDNETAELIDGAVRERKEVYLGRNGLTWNMVQLIHTHWRRRPVCKIKCKGIYTVDMPKIMRELERCAGGRVIWQHGGTVLLFRGRNYHWKQPPVLELPEDRSAEKKLTQALNPMEDRNPGGMGKWDSLQLSRRMNREDPLVWLDKNGYYGGLVHQVRTFFAAPQNDLAVIKCPGFVTGDIVKLALLLKALVPATVFQCDKERKQRIVLYRNPNWRCPVDDFTRLAETDLRPTYNPYPQTPKPKLRRTVEYEALAAAAAGEGKEGVWGSWSGLFEAPSDEDQTLGRAD